VYKYQNAVFYFLFNNCFKFLRKKLYPEPILMNTKEPNVLLFIGVNSWAANAAL